MQLDHINIKAPEALLEEVRDFYCAVLGLQEGARPKFSSPGYWLYAGERPLVHLSRGSERPASPAPSYLDHVAFRAVGLQAFTARLEAQGVDYRSSHIPELALTQLFFSDPAGTGLEINFAGETRA
jgi:catechol 2,3-dioxygenase-like lactoylglutathione lyase family enzyme